MNFTIKYKIHILARLLKKTLLEIIIVHNLLDDVFYLIDRQTYINSFRLIHISHENVFMILVSRVITGITRVKSSYLFY